jgi:hypothetical protein
LATYGGIQRVFGDESPQIGFHFPQIEIVQSVESENLSVDLGKKWSLCFKIWLPAQQNHCFLGKNSANRKLDTCTLDYKEKKVLTEKNLLLTFAHREELTQSSLRRS